jgi:hypothetical protein
MKDARCVPLALPVSFFFYDSGFTLIHGRSPPQAVLAPRLQAGVNHNAQHPPVNPVHGIPVRGDCVSDPWPARSLCKDHYRSIFKFGIAF